MTEYINAFKNYANFTARTSVRGYWMFVLFNIIASIILSVIDYFLNMNILSSIYSLALIIPGLAIIVRRLRDTGKKWPWIFISFVPLVGSIILIVLLCKKSVPENGIPTV